MLRLYFIWRTSWPQVLENNGVEGGGGVEDGWDGEVENKDDSVDELGRDEGAVWHLA